MNTSHASKIDLLIDRAALFKAARTFFSDRNILEVDCPALSQAAPIDLHIDIMEVSVASNQIGYLHSSPEYGMKRLLADGSGDIYQMSHVFRKGEIGPLHNPEFTMVEWYRLHFSFEQMIEETLSFIRLFLGDLPASRLSYRETFKRYLNIDSAQATPSELLALAHSLDLPPSAASWDKDTLLQLLMSFLIEPRLGENELFVLTDFPASQAALSKTIQKGTESVACRFEVYFRGIELANGYHELTDPQEQRLRLEASNNARQSAGKADLKIDEHFLNALEKGLPDCCGVAVGFDRLMLLRQKKAHLNDVLAFTWENA
ncbi:MAG: EF-P lysine aminoacylase GenX [Rhabdochlamydiaceae bacterium]|nr:EF-P lysine aminoacylase GenX [Rhabdochlamydiaceae bacterium]